LLNGLRLPIKVVLLIGTGSALTGVYTSSFTTNLAPYLSLYTLLNGLGSGILYFLPLVCGWEYFPERKGLITGIVLSSYGFGSFIFGIVSTMLCNPDSLDPTIEDSEQGITYFGPEVSNRVPYMIRSLVYIWAVHVLIALLLISRKPRARVLAAEANRVANQARSDIPHQAEIAGVRYCLVSKRFWQYFALVLLYVVFNKFFSYSYKIFGEDSSTHEPISDELLTWAGSIGSGILNGSSRILMGALQDKYSFRSLLGAQCIV
jgi:MFS transporter, OFA family, oxalate/formate antiporter